MRAPSSPQEIRRFFCSAWAKFRTGQPMPAIETLAAGWIAEHPQWHADFANAAAAMMRVYPDDAGSNPFLHMSMHLSISEQISIDQPRGIRQAMQLLTHRRGDLHRAHHEVMEYLGQILAEAQRTHRPPDGNAYLAWVQRRATSDRLSNL